MGATNCIHNVAIVGASGNIGQHMVAALLATGQHRVTALMRSDSHSGPPPADVLVKRIDYAQPATLVDALRGQDALVITLGGFAPHDAQTALIEAAAEADVPFVLPNEWSPDTADEEIVKDVFLFKPKVEARKAIAAAGKSRYIGVVTGFWYEWSLSIASAFGIDIEGRKAMLFDDGNTRVSVSSMPHVGRALAALLSLPVHAEGKDPAACLDAMANRVVYVNSFTLSQRDMLAAVASATGTSVESDWQVTNEPVHARYEAGLAGIREGDRSGFAKMLYGRVFFADGSGDFEKRRGTLNEMLQLPKDDLAKATAQAIERSKNPHWRH